MGGFGTLGCVPGVWPPPPTFRSFHPLIHGKTAWTSLALLLGSSKRQVVPFLSSVPVQFLPPGFGPPWISLWHPGVHPIHLCHPCPAVTCAAGPPHRSLPIDTMPAHRDHAARSRYEREIGPGPASSPTRLSFTRRRGGDGRDNCARLRRNSAAHACVRREEEACEDACHVLGAREPGRRAGSARCDPSAGAAGAAWWRRRAAAGFPAHRSRPEKVRAPFESMDGGISDARRVETSLQGLDVRTDLRSKELDTNLETLLT